MERFRKILVVSTMFVTVLSMSVVTVPNAGATASAGDLIKMSGLSSVYYLAADGKRYVFPNEQTYFSWYSDWSGVVTIPQTELEGYPLGKNVTVRPGTKLVKITTNPTVYAVEPNGTLRSIVSEANAISLYGADWAKKVIDVPDSFFTNYTTGSALTAGVYPAGSLVKTATSPDVYYYDGTNYRIFGSEAAFVANRFSFANVQTAPSTLTITAGGTTIAGSESTLTDTSSGAGGAAGAGTGLTVSLSSSTAGSSTLVAGQGMANLATFNFTASNDGAVKVTNLKVKRIGIGVDSTLPSLYLYDGKTRLTDSASVSSTYITFNNTAGVFTVDKGTTKAITIKSNIAASTAGQTVGVGVQAAADVVTDGASVSGTFPVNGNIHSIAAGTPSTVSFATSVTPAANTALDPQDDFTLWQNTVSVGTRSTNLESITFRQIGSVLQSDLKKFRLFIDGVQVGDTVEQMDANGYITFDLSAAPKSLTAADHVTKVLVNIVGGSSRTTSLSLQRTADATFIDSELNVPILIQTNSSTFSARSSGTQTISNGTLTITKKTTSPTGNVVKGASNVTLASYEFRAAGEPIKVETVRANAIVSDGSIDKLRNGKIYANGAQVGSTADLYAADGTSAYYTEYSMGSSLIVTPGSPVTVDIKTDIFDSDGTDNTTAGDTIQAQIASSTSNAQRTIALTYISSPGSDTAGNSLTVQTGSLSCSKNTAFSNKSVIVPQTTAIELGEFVCTAGSTEDVNLTTISVNVDNSTGNIDAAASSRYDIYDVYIIYGDSTGATKATIASTTNNWNVNKTVVKNGNIIIKVFGKLKSTIGDAATINVDLDATTGGTTAQSSTAVTITEADGQTITIGSGTLSTAVKSTPLDQIITGNQTVTAANYDISAANDSYTVNEIAIRFLDTNVLDVVGGVQLYDGATPLRTNGDGSAYTQAIDTNGYATTTGLSLLVNPGTANTKTITVKVVLNAVASNGATIGRNASTTLDTVRASSSGGTDTYSSTDRQGKQLIVYRALPIVTYESVATTAITNGASQEVYKFSIEPTGVDIGLKQFALALTWNDEGGTVNPTVGHDLELYNFILKEGTTDISTNSSDVTIVTDDGLNVETDTANTGASSTASTKIYFAWATEKQVSSKTTYSVWAKPRNFEATATSSDYVILTMSADTTNPGTAYYVNNGLNGLTGIWGLSTSATNVNTVYNFIWSDRSRDSHASASGSSTADWTNGLLVKNLPLSGTQMKKTP